LRLGTSGSSRRVSTRLDVSEIAEDTLFELFHVSDGATESPKAEDECLGNIRAGNVIKIAPEDTEDVLLVWQKQLIERRVCRTRATHGDRRWTWLIGFIRIPPGRSSGEKKLESVEGSEKLLFPVGEEGT